MTRVTPIAATPLPDMTVIELSVLVALLTDGPLRPDRLARAIADWFVRPVRIGDLEPCLAGMAAKGWVLRADVGSLFPARAAEATTLQLYAGLIRMIGAVERAGGMEGRLRPRGAEGEEL